jgi:hypothetical protein
VKITAPVKGYTDTTNIGPVTLDFKDGVAEYDTDKHGDLPDGVRAYLKEQGYGVGSTRVQRPEAPAEPLDPRSDAADEQVGSRTRDAAVDPREGDFLAPTNAGEANPHGSKVVSPEIHASQGVRPVKAGDVHVDDPAKQDEAEKAHAAAATDGTPVAITDQEKADAEAAGQPGAPLHEKEPEPVEPEDLKGQALEDALDERGLPKTGSADEKRARVAEHDARVAAQTDEGKA